MRKDRFISVPPTTLAIMDDGLGETRV